jgi:hypothetical protein
LIAIAKPFYFSHHTGQMAVASSLEAKAGDKLVRVGFSNSYRGTTDDAAILRVTGEKGATFFKQSFELKIKGDLIPEAAAEEIIGELQALFARHNALAALSAKAVFKPTKEFHTARHTMYSAEENMQIDSRERRGRASQIPRKRDPAGAQGLGKLCVNVVPVAASVKTIPILLQTTKTGHSYGSQSILNFTPDSQPNSYYDYVSKNLYLGCRCRLLPDRRCRV